MGKEEVDERMKRKLKHIEDQALVEEDPQELNKLFEEYRREYLKGKGNGEMGAKKQRTGEKPEDEGQEHAENEMVKRRKVEDKMNMEEVAQGSGDAPMYGESMIQKVAL